MSVNLFNQYNEALSNLLKWRNRYDKTSYAGKVVQNIFYGNLTMEILCGAIPAYFDGQLDKMNFENSYTLIQNSFEEIAIEKSQNLLPIILEERAYVPIGNIKYETFIPQIIKASKGDNKEVEDLEFSYIYYFLSNVTVKMWCALGISGISKIDAIANLSNVIIETSELTNYSQIENILGKLIVAPYLNSQYSPLNPLF
jgi:Ca2+/Na+ antiporter